ncbi:MAG: 23S rRNA (guanosine(2251)-2'-O)-methyltransferase RlmB [Synergistota bacterium]|nr:23S rRNA (guanosine(2251)-2'-O)-methyltransferase RlmB [Synergistota bacterium]
MKNHGGHEGAGRRKGENQAPIDWIFGRNAVKSIIEEAPDRCLKAVVGDYISGRSLSEMEKMFRDSGVSWRKAPRDELDNLSEGRNHQGVALRISPISLYSDEWLLKKVRQDTGPLLVVLLDHVQDPANAGAIVRSSEVFGAVAVVFPFRRAALPAASVMKSSAGAAARIPLVGVTNIPRFMSALKKEGVWLVGLDHNAANELGKLDIPQRMGLVTGSEEAGLSRLGSRECDFLGRIPMKGRTGSLNAAAAAAIGMYEWIRRNPL